MRPTPENCLFVLSTLLSLAVSNGCRPPSSAANPAPTNAASPIPQSIGPAWFEESAKSSGIQFRHASGHQSRHWMPEVETGGVGLLDYDGDGWLDIFFVSGGSLNSGATPGTGNQLYHNLQNGGFENVTAASGITSGSDYGMGCACADFDGDGWVDLYVTNLRTNRLWKNNGNGTFTDVTEKAGVACPSWSTSAAFFDANGDGLLDLIVVNYIKWTPETELACFSRGGRPDYCSPLNYQAPAVTTLYRNRGDGTFEDVTKSAGLEQAYGNGLGVAVGDFNQDGRLDFFVANDATPNQLWLNQGNFRFIDDGLLRGCALNSHGSARAGMGVVAVDLFDRGWMDLFVTHLVDEGNGLFINTNGYFMDTHSPRGPMAGSLSSTGFGVCFADFDHDGIQDLYVANGRVKHGDRPILPEDPYAEPNSLLRGLGGGEFEKVNPEGGTAIPLVATSRGLAVGDLDNDGDLDLVVVNQDGSPYLLRNVVPKRGRSIQFRVVDARDHLVPHARLCVEAAGRRLFRQAAPNEGYCSSQDPRVHVGLGDANGVDRVTVRWPAGGEEVFGPYPSGGVVILRQGSGKPSSGLFQYK